MALSFFAHLRLAAVLIAAIGATPILADPVRVAYFHTELSARGPGLLLRDLTREKTPEALDAVLAILVDTAPDIVLLADIDYDAGHEALRALQAALAQRGLPLPHGFTAAPNTGVPTGLDLDRDDKWDEPEDAQAFGEFRGAGGLVLLSRYPILHDQIAELTNLLWAEFPAANMPETYGDAERAVIRLSATGHWDVPVQLPDGEVLRLLTLHATPPVFDGPEDRNGRRNADQMRLWSDYLNGWRPEGAAPPLSRAVVLGTLNADPVDGEARPGALDRLRAHPRLQDPAPRAAGAAAASRAQGGVNTAQTGDPAFDTVDWPDDRWNDPGNLRVDYILPSRDLTVMASGLHWPDPDDAEALQRAEVASRHRLIWVDLAP